MYCSDGSCSSDGGNGDPVDFSRGPWITMLQDLDMDGTHVCIIIYTSLKLVTHTIIT